MYIHVYVCVYVHVYIHTKISKIFILSCIKKYILPLDLV